MQEETPKPETPPATPQLSRSERREKAALDALRALLKGRFEDQFGAWLPEESELPLQLQVKALPNKNWEVSFEPPLPDQLSAQFQEYQALRDVYHPGHVFCFRCGNSLCEHSLPPSCLHVFRGYTSTGVPDWSELLQVLIELKDDRVDRLYEKPPAILARLQWGRDLKMEQLSSFGRASKTYSLLGQVVAGYYPAPRDAASSAKSERVAITFQVVETRGADGRFELKLNTLSALPGDLSLSQRWASGWEPQIGRAYDVAVRSISRLEARAVAAREMRRAEDLKDALREVPSVLRRLVESLERGFRQQARRTHHVEHRRQEQRPVHKALEDSRVAAQECFYVDEKTLNIVVCGPQGRSHVFNAEGRHVTSFNLKPGGAEFRVRTRRWKLMPAGDISAFRNLLNQTPALDEKAVTS
ncbi:MAG: hypothetical protein V2A34_09845 [Lentisphaerota bacterium]